MSRRPNPSLAETIREAIRVQLAGAHVAIPGRIVSYDHAEQRADVEPSIEATLPVEGGVEKYRLPILQRVPIAFPQGGGYFLTFPLAPGDSVLLVFSDQSLDEWVQRSSGVASSRSVRSHHITDAIAIPGVRPFVAPLADADATTMAMGRDGGAGQIHIRPDRVDIGGRDIDAAKALARADRVEAQLTALKNAISEAAVAPMDGGATFKLNIMTALSAWPGSTGSNRVRGD